MARADEHGRLIASAAEAALSPLGCRRKGRSRFWYSDERFWAISIEFQPSSWSKGSYLNVGATWLWYESPGFGFNAGYRVLEFVPYESAAQFAPLMANMATRAAQEVLELRSKFSSVSDVRDHLSRSVSRDGWSVYHAAVAVGLAGDSVKAHELFHRMEQWVSDGYDWQENLKAVSAHLGALLDDPPAFRKAVLDLIERRRKLIGLPPDPECLTAAI